MKHCAVYVYQTVHLQKRLWVIYENMDNTSRTWLPDIIKDENEFHPIRKCFAKAKL